MVLIVRFVNNKGKVMERFLGLKHVKDTSLDALKRAFVHMLEIYDADFSNVEHATIKDQLETFIMHVRRVDDFIACHDLGSLAKKMAETEKHVIFPFVYHLIELALLLQVATASVKRVFSAINIIKNDLCNTITDDWLNDLMICFFKREIFKCLMMREL